MTLTLDLNREKYIKLEDLFKENGYHDYRWVAPEQIVVAQWVRLKCMFGCPNYGRKAACPPQVPTVDECRKFFHEYESAVIFHIQKQFDDPDDRFKWYKKLTIEFAKLERNVFLSGFEKAFILSLGGCYLCRECSEKRNLCKQPELARPSPEAMAVDVYSTVRKLGYPIFVKTDYTQTMDRYVFLLVQ